MMASVSGDTAAKSSRKRRGRVISIDAHVLAHIAGRDRRAAPGAEAGRDAS
jgi:hypothetical protein